MVMMIVIVRARDQNAAFAAAKLEGRTSRSEQPSDSRSVFLAARFFGNGHCIMHHLLNALRLGFWIPVIEDAK